MKRQVLVVDDVLEIAEELVETIRRKGDHAIMATEFHAAKHLLETNSFDLVIIDLRLKRSQGVDLLAFIKDSSQTQVVFLSGLEERLLRNVEESARDAGFRVLGRLVKPVLPEQISQLLEQMNVTPARQTERAQDEHSFSARAMRAALAEGSIQPFFQPQYSLRDGSLVGFEALARFVSSDGEVRHGPSAFAHLLDSGEFVWAIFEAVASQAIRRFREASDHQPNVRLSINVPARVCADRRFPTALLAWCNERAMSPDRLTLELTETAIDLTPEERLGLMKARVAGFDLSLDDFGSGAANLDRLEQIPFNEVKIDAWFLMRTLAFERGMETLREVSAFLGRRKVRTVIEGVESMELLERVGGGWFDIGQGYFFDPPLPASEAFDAAPVCRPVLGLTPTPPTSRSFAATEILSESEKEFLRELWVEGAEPDDGAVSVECRDGELLQKTVAAASHSCLIVEDDPLVAEEIRDALQSQDLVCDYADSVGAAEQAIQRLSHIKVVFLDLNLPDGAGQSLFAKLRAQYQGSLPGVVVLTGYGSSALQRQVRSLGAAQYLEKPINAEQIRSAYAQVLDAECS